MNKYREALRLISTSNHSDRMIGRVIGIAPNTVGRYRKIVKNEAYDWNAIEAMNDAEIERILKSKYFRNNPKVEPDWAQVHREMQLPDVTLQLLWEDYRIANPINAYSYSQFTHHYREFKSKLDLTMRQNHRAGEMVYVDFAGRTIPYTPPATGVKQYAQVFVSAMGCSSYTFVYAVRSQSLPDWIKAHNKMFYFYQGVPQIVVPDNLKAAVTRPGSSPQLTRTYMEQAKHYGVVIIPARVRRPQDKSKAEVAVQIASRWIMAKLRHRQFFSLEEINAAIAELLKDLNERPFKRLPGCRRSRFDELDKPLLSPLPVEPFEYAEWTSLLKVGPDYHLHVKDHYYSVPHSLVGAKLEARVTGNTVEFYHQGRRVASHIRSHEIGSHTTLPAHQPKAHRCYAEQTPERILVWANSIGPATTAVVQHQFDSLAHPLLGIRTSTTLQRLAKECEPERFEAACRRAQKIGSLTVKSIKSILKRRLEDLDDDRPVQVNLPLHDNLRGPSYYTAGGH